ncbi:hypothetical protein [Streptomyces violaceus]|uniref:Uncharacterized protein n=1 Tax=Streptomyces violaceus TaxID=1936 RepID=A0ABY9UMH7_STRVL|nr:hypothetical protein [Streptomyces janthinus]WND24106.1 hypothetical protein RI060_43075 [Streptomyces janthinus]GGS96129.1 hypothetical protein GCM10010270_80110 [Streptomyces janthinus]
MAARLRSTVYVTDPETHQTVTLHPGTSPEPRLAALVTNKAAWVDGKLPRLPKTKADDSQTDQGPTGEGQDDASGAASDTSAEGDQSSRQEDNQAAPAAKKTAARKTAATSRSRGRDAAGEGDSGE